MTNKIIINRFRFSDLIIVSILLLCSLDINLCSALPSNILISIKHTQTSKTESIKLFFSGQVALDYITFNLRNPDRFVLDIKNSYFPEIHDEINTGMPVLKKIRISQFTHDRVRLVIDQKISPFVSVRGKGHSDYKILTLSMPASEISTLNEKNVTSAGYVSPVKKEINNSRNKIKAEKTEKTEKITTAVKHEKALSDSLNENMDTLFSVPENSSTPIPDIIPDEQNVDGQPDTTGTTEGSSKLSINGDLKNETAYRLDEPHHLSKVKNILSLKASGSLSDNLSYVIGSRFSYDAVFDLTSDYNHKVEDDQRLEADLRDAYFDLGLGNFDFRLGNQQIVWGQAVGLFFADIVNPKNLREFILPDLDQIRIPVFAANMEYSSSSIYFQMIFIPFPKFNEFGKRGSEFDLSKPFYNDNDDGNADIVLKNLSDPPDSLDNSEVGFRISKMTDGWDYSLFYLYDYYNFPVNYRQISLNPAGSNHPVTITYSPEYERMHRFGSTFSKEYRDVVFKGEFIYSNTMFFQSSDTTDPDGIEKSDRLDWLLGVDYTFFTSLETNFQLMQNVILDHESSITQNQYSTSFSIWMKTGFFGNLIEPELFFVSSLNQRDFMLRPKVTCNYNDRLKFIFGSDIFYGQADGTFGIFDKDDRLYIEIFYQF